MVVMPNRDRLAERREATRREILEAAWALAQDKGLAEFTLRDVAERVGMRAPSLYSHFESKHGIYDAMFGQGWIEYEQARSWPSSRIFRPPAGLRCVRSPAGSSTSRLPTRHATSC